MLRRSVCIPFWLLFATTLLTSNVLAQPKVTRIQFDTALAPGSGYIFMPNSEAPEKAYGDAYGITWPMTPAKYIKAGSLDSDDIADGDPVISQGFDDMFGNWQPLNQGDASLFGDSNGYGMFLFNVTEGSMNGNQTERRHGEMRMWRIKNSNLQMMGEDYGPANISTVSMNNAIPTGTSVTVTIDMQGESPHLIAVFGGTPTVTYVSAGTGTLIVQSSTINTRNAGGRGGTDPDNQAIGAVTTDDTITSGFGMCLVTNDLAFGNPPTAVGIVAWTDAWPGDIYLFAPGLDSNSNVGAGSAGTLGGSSARIGLTVNGPTGDLRTLVMFVPSDVLETIYGPGVTSGDITGYVNGTQVATTATSDNSTFTADGVAVTGVRLSFDYTFASATDTTVGVSTTTSSTGSSGNGCFIATSAFGS